MNTATTNSPFTALVAAIQGDVVSTVNSIVGVQYDMGRAGQQTDNDYSGETVVKTVKVTGESNADKVRAMITAAKVNGVDAAAVVGEVVATLGMKKALASAYVKNNWDKA